ncbi:FAD-dependent oxidoreductase [Aminipila butyrica]|uniref:FAD-dependent oxidoreductase n=1 Tax=Aminipila butyrica TaxID=433296 RepID=A0A858BYK1_9FIRM|nr:FAD-dependent oxidoreductase [Aminipila butyrica]QIB70532.1 FAD-dependent oxidoreductase [Aminipila butyrica]
MYKVVVIGGGWSGCAAALAARKAGASVVLVEKTDLLLGLGNVGGIMRNNGRYTAAEENIALGASELFSITDNCSRHRNIDFPGHKHASLYDVMKVEPQVRRLLQEMGVEIRLVARVIDVVTEELNHTSEGPHKRIKGLIVTNGAGLGQRSTDLETIEGDVFIECTGSTGPMGNCLAYGNGCCMCILRCPAFGPRVSISQKAGVMDIMGMRKDGAWGAFSGSGKLEKGSLSEEIQQELNETGVVVIPLAEKDVAKEKLNLKVCQQYALTEYAENIVLLDTGYAKIMTPFFPLEKLRQVPGLENARYADPYAGGKGNSIRYLSVTERDDTMKVRRIENLLCGGEKSGLFVGHTEAISTGSLAGYNSARFLKGLKPMEMPRQLAVGDLIAYANERLETREGLMNRYTFAGAEFFQRMQEQQLYSIDSEEISRRVDRVGLRGIYQEKII